MIKIIDGLFNVPTVNDYFSAFKKLEITDLQKEILKVQYCSPYHQIKVEDLAISVSQPIPTINMSYGKLGHRLKDLLGVETIGEEQKYWIILSLGFEYDGCFYWQMRNQVAYALKDLQWF